MSATHTATGIEALVCADIAERQQTRGVPKYGKTLAEQDACELERLTHLYQELLDGAIYCKWRMEQIKERRAARRSDYDAHLGKLPALDYHYFVFDVESVGLYGEGFAVGGGVYHRGECLREFCFSSPKSLAVADSPQSRQWVDENIPDIKLTHAMAFLMREEFWNTWLKAKNDYPGILMAGECVYPVECNFLATCVGAGFAARQVQAPYPLIDISAVMLAAGMDPMATYDREPNEHPKHDPLADARQSARLLWTALQRLTLICK